MHILFYTPIHSLYSHPLLSSILIQGFESAKLLAKKMTVLYKLSREQLSKQFHYDFGLRALKSVLVMAGKRGRDRVLKIL